MEKEKVVFPESLNEYKRVARHPLAKEVYKKRQEIIKKFPCLRGKDGRC